MPGPNSAPNGDKSLIMDKDNRKREALMAQGKLVTGKTARKRGA